MSGIIIGLVGRQGSGKDTVADFIAQDFGFNHIKFSTALKEICDEFDIDSSTREAKERRQLIRVNPLIAYTKFNEVFGDFKYKAFDLLVEVLEPYKVMDTRLDVYSISPRKFQQLLGTEVGRKLYPDIWIDAALDEREGNVVISDVRFLDEAEVCDYLIFVDRPLTVGDLSHTSEKFTEEVYNFFNASWDSRVGAELDYIRGMFYRGKLFQLGNDEGLQELWTDVLIQVDDIIREYK